MTEKEQHYLEILLEEMNGKFSLVLEGHDAIRKEFNGQLDDIKEQQKLFMSLLKGSHEELKEDIQSVRVELKEDIQSVRVELKEEIRAVDKCSEARDAALTAELKEEIRAVDKHSRERDEELVSEIRAVGDKACLCVDARRQVDGHESRILFLERKAA